MIHKSFPTLLRCMMSAGVLAALVLLATAFASAQAYQPLPFPQAANTALNAAPDDVDSLPWMPSAITKPAPHAVSYETGSLFPAAGNPARDEETPGQCALAVKDRYELGSPFPCEANPARK